MSIWTYVFALRQDGGSIPSFGAPRKTIIERYIAWDINICHGVFFCVKGRKQMAHNMQVVNVTIGETLASHAMLADSFLTRFIGLQGRRALAPGEGLILLPTASIHTFFMRFPIDAVFVDEHNRVTRVRRALRPWRIGPVASGALYCVELPAGAAASTRPGHEIALRPL